MNRSTHLNLSAAKNLREQLSRSFAALGMAGFLVIFVSCAIARAETRPPNIIVILADDFGVGDVHALYPSNTLATPNLDRFVEEGMHFTDAHSGSALCSPSRYGILTGRYAWRTPLQHWVLAPYEPPLIDENRLTLPAFLKQHGYQTACMGKWHLGWNWPGPQPSRRVEDHNAQLKLDWDFSKPIQSGPTERGFDTYFGVDLPNYPPLTFIEGNRTAPLPTAQFPANPKRNGAGSGFAGWPAAPGWKLDKVLPEITRHAVRYVHAQAATKKPFFLYFAITAPHAPVVPSKQFAGKSGIAPMADYLMEVDWSAGEVIKAIDDAGIRDNTLVVFTGDNGPAMVSGVAELAKAHIARSGPYRGAKGDIWEGGHREPLVMRWPGHIKPASISSQIVCLNDLYATCAEILGAKLPDNAAEDSTSFLAAASGGSSDALRTTLVNHSGRGEFAYRDKNWKLVFKAGGTKSENNSEDTPTTAQLYDLSDDIAEKRDIAAEHADIVKDLTVKLQAAIDNGRTRPGAPEKNDRNVRFDIAPKDRWAAPTN
jgi:arylsulfatase A